MPNLKQLIQTFLKECADFEPLWALASGIPGHEGRVADFSEGRVRRHRAVLSRLSRELKLLKEPVIGSDTWLEYRLFQSELALHRYYWNSEGRHVRYPTLYVGDAVYGLWYLFLRISSKSLKVEAALNRLKDSDYLVAAAKANLENVPRLWVDIALQETEGYREFLKVVRRELLKMAPRRKKEILQAVRRADEVAEDYFNFLKGPLKKKASGDLAVGEKNFNFLLRNYHHYPMSASGLLRFGKRQFEEIKNKLRDQARKMDRKTAWPQLLAQVKKHHPSSKKLLGCYRDEVKNLKAFLRKRNLVGFPKGESLEVIETPGFTRSTIPYAAYVDPPMFSGKNRGTFFVTPVTEKNKSKQREILEEHNWSSLKVTALHEGYPGHHLQFAKQKLAKGSLGRIFHCSSFYEGWALYCEELMYEQGYYDDSARLLQLRDQLWRACRVLVDVGLQTHSMTYDQAVRFLSREAKMSPIAARADVNWYTMSPTVPQSYLTGMLRIKALRDRVRARDGVDFRMKKFHDDFLKYGAVPIPLVEKMMFGEES